jgi:hypothetical protein
MQAMEILFVLVCAPAAQDERDVIEAGPVEERPWVPDLRRPGMRAEIPPEKRLDVVILADGYLEAERGEFEREVRDWYEGFLRLRPWSQFRGAFRVRGLWTASPARATTGRRSWYGIASTAGDVGDVTGRVTRERIFEALGRVGVNPARARGRLTHATVVVLVRNGDGLNPSGLARDVVSADGKVAVAAGFAHYTHHEFGHAFGGLRDEYIRGPGSRATQRAPERLSIFTVSNLGYTRELRILPWAHLAPGSAVNPDAESVIGVLWTGGVAEEGAWHSEARCLMNGAHENWDLQRTFRGASLRDRERFCFWCEEILVARTLERTGQLGEGSDGEALWNRWESLRPLYHEAFDVPGRIREQNARNAQSRLGEAKIFARPLP